MKRLIFISIFILLLFVGCSTIDPIIVEQIYLEMDVFYPGEKVPENYNIIGNILIGPYNYSPGEDCGLASVLNRAAERTKELGGNAFKVTNLKEPSIVSNCYRISALALISND